MTVEREIDLRELFYVVLKKWRVVIIAGIILAALLGLYKLGVGLNNTLDPESLAAAQEKYEIELNDYIATGELLAEDIATLRNDSERQAEYNENSMLMKIDAMNKCVGSFNIYIDSKYQIDPALTYQNIDLTTRLLSAYYSYLTGGELYSYVLNNTDLVSEIRYLTEILFASYNTGSSAITITCNADTEDHVQEILSIVKTGIAAKYPDIKTAIGDHDYSVIMESSYSTVDLNLDNTQKINRQIVSENANSIAEKNEDLRVWAAAGEPRPEFGYRRSVIDAVKFAIIGGVAGVFVAVVYYAGVYILTHKISGDAVWHNMGVVVFGTVYTAKKRVKCNKIDKWIDKLMGYEVPETSLNESCALASANLCAMLKKQNAESAVVVSIAGDEVTKDVIENMNKTAERQLDCVGNVLTDSNAVIKLNDTDKIILLAEDGRNTIDEVERIKTLASAWGKELMGALVIK